MSACGCCSLEAQQVIQFASPGTLVAGAGDQTLTLYLQTPIAAVPLTARWNGLTRAIALDGPLPNVSDVRVSLTADDLALSQLGQLSLYDARTDTLIGSVGVPVVYAVAASGTLYDGTRGRLFLTTPSTSMDPRFPANSLIALDPENGVILMTLGLNAPGGAIAISNDAKELYVVVSPSTIRQIDPDSLTVLQQFSLGVSTPGVSTPGVKDIAVMPGTVGTLAVQYYPNLTTPLLGILDNGVSRPNTFGDGTAAYSLYDRMLFSPDGRYLFAGNNAPGSLTQALLVDGGGFPKQTPLSATGGGPIDIINDTLYTSTGVSFDWRSLQATGNLDGAFATAVDPANNRILGCFETRSSSATTWTLQAFELDSQSPLAIVPITVRPNNIYRYGSDGLIFQMTDSILTFHTPLAGPAPSVAPDAIVNGASLLADSIAPGEILSIFGSSLGPAAGESFTVSANKVVVPFDDVEVWFDRQKGTVLFAGSGQINVGTPFELQPGSTVNVQVWNHGIPSRQIPLAVTSAAPALLTRDGSGKGLAVVVNQDGSANAPVPRGSIIGLYGTGGGIYPGARDGAIGNSASSLSAGVQVTIGGQAAEVVYAGEAPQLVSSVVQLNVLVPDGVEPGSAVPVVVTVDGHSSPQGVYLEVR
jgi:uncharacterized protein (TIGR03437 family)